MNKITTTGLTTSTEIKYGQIHVLEENYFFLTCDNASSDNFLLVSLNDGLIWTNAMTQDKIVKELIQHGFKKFTGVLIMEVE